MEFTMSYTVLTCCHAKCGLTFAVPVQWEDLRRTDHEFWFCPNGHGQAFRSESAVERAIREKAELERRMQARLNESEHLRIVAEREAEKEKRQRRKIERRVAAGVCACCNRTFPNLAAHMSTKHKGFAVMPRKAPKLIAEG